MEGKAHAKVGTELRAPEALKGSHWGGFLAHLAPDLVLALCPPPGEACTEGRPGDY